MMTSLPTPSGGSVLFHYTCGNTPQLRWKFDDVPLSQAPFQVSGDECDNGGPWGGNQNNRTITRVGRYKDDTGNLQYVVRISVPVTSTSPPFIDTLAQVKIYEVRVPTVGNTAQVKHLKTFSPSPAHVMQFTAVEADPVQVGLNSGENTTFYYWVESTPSAGGYSHTMRGILVRDTELWSPEFQVSSASSRSTSLVGPRSFDGPSSGHYMKGGFYFNPHDNQLRYLAQWIEGSGSSRNLHVKIFKVPR